ncbi:MAG: efflux RND transporter periplasmic adaptor subunit [Christensenellales bacterium]|jgi:HlyD family secretion protein
MKRLSLGILAVALVLCAGCAGNAAQNVYVTPVGSLLGLEDSTGQVNRYAGVVETLDTVKVQKASDRTVDEIFVAVGDEVNEGDPLFSYDVDEMILSLEKQKLELENIKNSIFTMNNQIDTLTAQLAKAKKEAARLEYTLQIQTLQLQVMEAQYNQSAKELEIRRAEAQLENTTVFAPMSGTVQSIQAENQNNYDPYAYYGGSISSGAFITITDTANFRIKCTVAEQNALSLAPGMRMVVRSRVDDTTWTGTLSSIDFANPVGSGSSEPVYEMGGQGDGTTTPSKYPFYVALDSREGLILGQHVTVEPELPGSGEGLWLPEAYIMDIEGNPSVWANEKGRIVRRTLTLGGYDELAGRHEVLSGLSLEDAIAFPEDWITPGAPTTTVRAAPAANPDGGAGLPADGDVYEFGFDESESVPVDDMGDAGYDPEAKG